MSVLTNFFTSLANKIRSKTGNSETLTPPQMIDAIDDIYTPTQTKTVTASTSTTTVTPDSGYALSSVTVNPTPSQSKSATPSTSAQTISPDSGNLLSSVTVDAISPQNTADITAHAAGRDSKGAYVYFPYGWYPQASGDYCYIRPTDAQAQAMHAHTGTYTPTSRAASLDMGQTHTYRYVNTNSVPNTNSGTYTYDEGSAGGTYDMGETNTIRYVNAENVFIQGKKFTMSNLYFRVSTVAAESSAQATWPLGTLTLKYCAVGLGNPLSVYSLSKYYTSGTTAGGYTLTALKSNNNLEITSVRFNSSSTSVTIKNNYTAEKTVVVFVIY